MPTRPHVLSRKLLGIKRNLIYNVAERVRYSCC